MADIFKSGQTFSGKVFSAHNFRLTFGSSNSNGLNYAGALVQNVQMQYQQQVAQVRELNSTNIYYIQQMPQGQASFNRIITDSNGVQIITDLADPCFNHSMSLGYGRSSCQNGQTTAANEGVTLTAGGVIATSVNYTATVDNYQMQENGTFMFATLSSDGSAANGVSATSPNQQVISGGGFG